MPRIFKYKIGDLVWVHISYPFKQDFLCEVMHIVSEVNRYPYICHGLYNETIGFKPNIHYTDEEWMSNYIVKDCPEYLKI